MGSPLDPVVGPPEPVARPALRRTAVVTGVVAAAVAVLLLAGLAGYRWAPDQPAAAPPTPSPSAPEQLTVAQVYEALVPSVVSIRARGGEPGTQGGGASGTGLVANADGTILTALHVVEDAGAVEVSFADGTRSAATVVATDPDNDIAALAATTLPSVVVPAVLGGGVAVGEQVVAIGNQLGLADSTTAGIVSGLGRSMARDGAADLEGLIQFDAAVNPGSSGGPLVNARGQTVGIVVALANPTDDGTFIGIGFAVPIGTAVAAGDADGSGPPGPPL